MGKIGVIDEFSIIIRHKDVESALCNIEVRFYILGEFLVCSRFQDVSHETIRKLNDMLEDWTSYNAKVEYQCQAIALPTMLFLINEEVMRSRG